MDIFQSYSLDYLRIFPVILSGHSPNIPSGISPRAPFEILQDFAYIFVGVFSRRFSWEFLKEVSWDFLRSSFFPEFPLDINEDPPEMSSIISPRNPAGIFLYESKVQGPFAFPPWKIPRGILSNETASRQRDIVMSKGKMYKDWRVQPNHQYMKK